MGSCLLQKNKVMVKQPSYCRIHECKAPFPKREEDSVQAQVGDFERGPKDRQKTIYRSSQGFEGVRVTQLHLDYMQCAVFMDLSILMVSIGRRYPVGYGLRFMKILPDLIRRQSPLNTEANNGTSPPDICVYTFNAHEPFSLDGPKNSV